MRSQNHPIILYIDRSGFSVFQDTQPNTPRFNFTQDIVANLDVVNKEQFVSLLTTFIQINKIVPSTLVVILSDTVIYFKDLMKISNSQPEEIQNFLDNIPFEEVLARVIKIGESSRITAVNKDLVMTIADVFVSKGSVIEGIIPSFAYGPNVNFGPGLTQENIQAILEGSEIVKLGNLLTDQQKINSGENLENGQKGQQNESKSDLAGGEKKPQSLRQYILIGVFVTLLVILAVVYLNLGESQAPLDSKTKSSADNNINTPAISPAVQPALPQAPVTIPIDLKKVSIEITHNSQSEATVSDLKSKLIQIGFEDVVSEVSEDTAPEKSSIVFSQNIPPDLRNNVITEVKKILPNISILENQDLDQTVTILIGKS